MSGILLCVFCRICYIFHVKMMQKKLKNFTTESKTLSSIYNILNQIYPLEVNAGRY